MADMNPSILRYRPGPTRDVIGDMTFDPHGFFPAGCRRRPAHFAPDHGVVDYRQLDPDHVEALASALLDQFLHLGVEAPPAVHEILDKDKHPEIDGRLITDPHELLHPTDSLNMPDPQTAVKATPNAKRDVIDKLQARQPIPCPSTCFSDVDCFLIEYFACFFPSGPGSPGLCFYQ
ncbi:predicted protein [Chaetomium globosum CBS 148.51]|uniref:Uncharacterized protein n=1 Tax=Chaetomium globosum (strain ATCC 6205 / CBS 148.51 / DSM 1962 / NBRC 6347 / NRRL 1970) TaxID=306901 RepID=Q2H2E5_CHAGB|nr:uncharacterized protein CHGG_04051 [Chaetomium globosum CBS 148.51]EAQ87432.1 predicted protein [Chaetomium globosum CBS 148.51]